MLRTHTTHLNTHRPYEPVAKSYLNFLQNLDLRKETSG